MEKIRENAHGAADMASLRSDAADRPTQPDEAFWALSREGAGCLPISDSGLEKQICVAAQPDSRADSLGTVRNQSGSAFT
jgi:hypothetical protein